MYFSIYLSCYLSIVTIWPEIAISHLSEIDYILFLMACGKIKWIKCSQHKTSFPKKKKKLITQSILLDAFWEALKCNSNPQAVW